MFVDVEAGPNLDRYFSMLYHELETPREVEFIKFSRGGEMIPVRVTGWDHDNNTPCPAYACRIEESGDGVALLIFGGNGGLRFQEADDEAGWNLQAENQWAETHLVYPKDSPVIFKEG